MSEQNQVRLEVGKWYQLNYYPLLVQYDGREFYIPNSELGLEVPIQPQYHIVSGPHSIEPGDTVKPKPKDDKCWETYSAIIGKAARAEFMVTVIDEYSDSECWPGNGDGHLPLSCLILLRKGQQDKAAEKELLGSACEKCGAPFTARHSSHKTCINCAVYEKPAAPTLHPATLPCANGKGTLDWPDTKPCLGLDALPEDLSTAGDVEAKWSAEQQDNRVGFVLTYLKEINRAGFNYVSNSDRAKIAGTIPQIERELAKLKGRVMR